MVAPSWESARKGEVVAERRGALYGVIFNTFPPSSLKRAKAEVRIERQCLVICGVLSPRGGQNSNASVFFGVVSPLGSPGDRRPGVLEAIRGALE